MNDQNDRGSADQNRSALRHVVAAPAGAPIARIVKADADQRRN